MENESENENFDLKIVGICWNWKTEIRNRVNTILFCPDKNVIV